MAHRPFNLYKRPTKKPGNSSIIVNSMMSMETVCPDAQQAKHQRLLPKIGPMNNYEKE